MCDLSDPRINQTYQAIIEGEPTDWLLLGYNDTRDVISLYSHGTNGLSEFRNQLQEEILFGFVRVEDRFILISYVPDQVSGVRRARTLVHSRSVASLFEVHHAQLTASSLNDLSDANIRTRLKLGENQVPNRSRPNSLSERKRSSLQARRKSQQQQPSTSSERPSLPSSPTTSSYTAEPDTFEEAREEFSTPSLDTTPTPASLSDVTPTSTSTVDANDYQDNNSNNHDQPLENEPLDNAKQQQKLEEEQQLQQRQHQQEQERLAEQKRLEEEAKQRRIVEEQEQKRIADEKRAAEQHAAELQRRAQEEQAEKQRQKELAEKQAKEKEEQQRLALEKEREEKQRLLQKQLQQAEKTKDVIIQGFSNIQTSTSPFWRRRYFIVRGKNLALYRDHDTPTPITIIDLKSVNKLRWADMEIDTFVPNAFMLDMNDGGSYQIFADHQQDASTIFTALQTVIQSK